MLNRTLAIGAISVVAAATTWTAASVAGDSGGKTSIRAQVVAHANDARVENDWPVGEEWRYKAPWASPVQLYSAQYDLWQRAIATCMGDAGFKYTPYSFDDPDAVYGRLNPLYKPGLAMGYEEPEQVDPEAGSSNTAKPPEFADALLNPDGCADRARAFVYDSPESRRSSDLLNSAIPSVDAAIAGYEGTSDGQARATAWSRCMKAHGLGYASPKAVRGKFADDGSVSAKELSTRQADYECDVDAELTQSRSKWEAKQFAAWRDGHAPDIEQIQKSETAAQDEISALDTTLTTQGSQALPRLPAGVGNTAASTLPNS